MRRKSTRAVLTVAATFAAVLLLACGDDPTPPTLVEVRAEILDADAAAAVDVTATSVEEGEELSTASHGVLVTWQGDGAVVLGDPRFLGREHLLFEPGELVTVGRACSVYWQEDGGYPSLGCNDDLVLTEIAPGARHEYPLTLLLTGRDDTYKLANGIYTRDEIIEWWHGSLDEWHAVSAQGRVPVPDGAFTIRVTYTIE